MFSWLKLLIVAAGFLAMGPAQAVTSITGAGASFPYPLYTKWISEYQKTHPDLKINYQSIGSGGGIKQFLEQTIDFGATDAPMTDEQIGKAKAGVIHVPTVLGAVVVIYNLAGVEKGLKLTADIVADIFLGKLTKWNDPRITKLNPGVNVTGDILVVHRSDGSGTSHIFTDYLSKTSAEWKTKVGTATAVNWPVGLGGKGNEGVAGMVQQTKGSIGYVELIYAENNKLPYAALKNAGGQFVMPSLKSVTAAAASALKTMPADFRVSLTDAPGKESYPVSGFTYLLIQQNPTDANKANQLKDFLKWALGDGQKLAEPLFYAPLPKPLLKKIETKLSTVSTKKT